MYKFIRISKTKRSRLMETGQRGSYIIVFPGVDRHGLVVLGDAIIFNLFTGLYICGNISVLLGSGLRKDGVNRK